MPDGLTTLTMAPTPPQPSSFATALLDPHKLCTCGTVFPTLDRLAFHLWSSHLHSHSQLRRLHPYFNTRFSTFKNPLLTPVICTCGAELANIIRLIAHLLGTPSHDKARLTEELSEVCQMNRGICCLLCMRHFASLPGLDAHFNQHHLEHTPGALRGLISSQGTLISRNMTCPCGYVFTDLPSVVMHDFSTPVHHGRVDDVLQRANFILREGKCHCTKVGMKTLEAYDQHYRTSHGNQSIAVHLVRPKYCSCGQAFGTLQQFCSHLAVARGMPEGKHTPARGTESVEATPEFSRTHSTPTARPPAIPSSPAAYTLRSRTPYPPETLTKPQRSCLQTWDHIEAELNTVVPVYKPLTTNQRPITETRSPSVKRQSPSVSPVLTLPHRPMPAVQKAIKTANSTPTVEEWLLTFDSDENGKEVTKANSDFENSPEEESDDTPPGFILTPLNLKLPRMAAIAAADVKAEDTASALPVEPMPKIETEPKIELNIKPEFEFEYKPEPISEPVKTTHLHHAAQPPLYPLPTKQPPIPLPQRPINSLVDSSLGSIPHRRIQVPDTNDDVDKSCVVGFWGTSGREMRRRGGPTIPLNIGYVEGAGASGKSPVLSEKTEDKKSGSSLEPIDLTTPEIAIFHPTPHQYSLATMFIDIPPASSSKTPGMATVKLNVSLNLLMPRSIIRAVKAGGDCWVELSKCLLAAAQEMGKGGGRWAEG